MADLAQRRRPGTADKRAWTVAMVESSARSRGSSPEGRLLGIFDVLDAIINRADREARDFVEVLAGMSTGRPLDAAGTVILDGFRDLIETLAAEAGLVAREELALSWRILMKGAILRAVEGDLTAAARARSMAVDLIVRHRPTALRVAPLAHDPEEFDASVAFDLDEYDLYSGESDAEAVVTALAPPTPESRRTDEINDLAWSL
jgi:hypothetical protein